LVRLHFSQYEACFADNPVQMLRDSQYPAVKFPVTPEFSDWRSEQREWRESCVLLDLVANASIINWMQFRLQTTGCDAVAAPLITKLHGRLLPNVAPIPFAQGIRESYRKS
jgi:hypothetical protein